MNIYLFVDLFQARLDKKACLGNSIIFIKSSWASVTSTSSSRYQARHEAYVYIQLTTSSLCSGLSSNGSLSQDAD